jgi:hypothetical protein
MFLTKLKIELLYDPAIPLLALTKRMTINIIRDICIPKFITAVFSIARLWNQPVLINRMD